MFCLALHQPLGQGYHGGYPPSLLDIEDEKEKIDSFVEMWLGTHTSLPLDLQRFLIANMLRHWKQTVDIIQKEPRKIFEGDKYKNHVFINKVFTICNFLDISETTFNKWTESVKLGFINRNALSMNTETLKEIGFDKFVMDGRSFLEKVEANAIS